MVVNLPVFPLIDPNPDLGAPGIRFKKPDITDPKRQSALLLHYAGEAVNDIFETLTVGKREITNQFST